MELGRYAVGECGTYCTKVIDKKTVRNRDLLILEGGINHLLRPALTGQSFPCEMISSSNKKKKKFHVHGPLCTALDKLGVFELPGNIDCEDWVAFKQVGAYGLTESMPLFLCHDLPAEVTFKGGKMKIVRKVSKAENLLV